MTFTDRALILLRATYVTDRIDLETFEQSVGAVLAAGRDAGLQVALPLACYEAAV